MEKTTLQQHRVVKFESPVGNGTRTVVVMLTLETPRIMAYVDEWGQREPMSLFLDEIECYVQRAREFLGKGAQG